MIQLDAETKRNGAGTARLDLVLDAQRRAVESDIAFHRAEADYNLALSRIHFARGTLLDSLQVYLTEGPWSADAHRMAARQSQRFQERHLPLTHETTPPVSWGAYPQRLDAALPVEEVPPPVLFAPPAEQQPAESEGNR